MQNKKQLGFTLMELLVVIAIVGILSALLLASLNVARQRSRDARRKADMYELINAINLYLNDHGSYPVGEDDTGSGQGIDFSSSNSFIPQLVSGGYLPRVVRDPGGGIGMYWYAIKNSNFNNKALRYNFCGGDPSDPDAKALLVFWLEAGQSSDFNPGPTNANSVCFF